MVDYIEVIIETELENQEWLEELCMESGALGTATYSRAQFDQLSEQYGRLKLEKNRVKFPEKPQIVVYYEIDHFEEQWKALKELLHKCLTPNSYHLLSIKNQDNKSWATEWKKYYQPIQISGHLHIIPSWQKREQALNGISIYLDPEMAFGTGDHPTTILALQLLENYLKEEDYVLDFGTGSGILALVAQKLGARRVLGIDIDPFAVATARENAQKNQSEEITFLTRDHLKQLPEQFNLITANITADILIPALPDMWEALLPAGRIILSGVYIDRTESLEEALEEENFIIKQKNQMGDWLAYYAVKKLS